LRPKNFLGVAANLFFPPIVVPPEAGTQHGTLKIDPNILGGGYQDE
jgi:hypothetical protein